MNQEESIISLYLRLEEAYRSVLGGTPLRTRGYEPALGDVEVLTIEIFGEWQGMEGDKAVWRYFRNHWHAWFPALGSYTNFTKHCSNLRWIKEKILEYLWPAGDVHVIDGVPLPLCAFARANRCRRMREDAAYGHCAAKQMTFWGFKGYPLMRLDGPIIAFWTMPANEDERSIFEHLKGKIKGLLLGDKGFQAREKSQKLQEHGITLCVPARKNMPQTMTEKQENQLKNLRRRIETAIGQLCETYKLNRIKARSPLAFFNNIFRKIIAYNLKIKS